ncbi:MAG: hypothetical protein LBT10_05635 [Methanobrevibacter sp.]|nr:hypothetical protein [Methanobrevibacter sp.]
MFFVYFINNEKKVIFEGIDPPDPVPVGGSFNLPLEKTGFPLIVLIAVLSLFGFVFRRFGK